MSLFNIKDKLYKKDQEKDLSRHEESPFDPWVAQQEAGNKNETEDLWREKKEGLAPEEKTAFKRGLYALGGILFVIALVVIGYKIKQSLFGQDKVAVAIIGPHEAESGEFLSYEINYQNNNRTELRNVSFRLTYPETFEPEPQAGWKKESDTSSSYELGNIPAGKSGKINVTGRIYSPRGALIYFKTEMIYSPARINSRFVADNHLGVNISSSPISLELMSPQNVPTGDEINYAITYRNNGDRELTSLRLKADYSDGFTFSSSDPRPEEGNNIWYIGSLLPGQAGKITISGKLEGERDSAKPIKIYLGVLEGAEFVSYSEESASTKIVSSPLTISQTVNGTTNFVASAGETLNFAIQYRNDGNIGLRDVIVTEKIDNPILDYTTLETQGGFFDSSSKIITWKASDHSELKNLAPAESGMINFSIKIKDVIPINNENDKNFSVSSIAKIDSPDIPTPINMNKIIAGNKVDIKINSKLILETRGYYVDGNISNSGPIPPKVGQKTTYTLHWIVKSLFNDVTDARLETVLPTGVRMTGQVYPENLTFEYNERNNSLIWNIGNIAAGTGIISSAKEIKFQVEVIPAPNQVGQEISLLAESTLTAKDLFTNQNLVLKREGKTTELKEDTTLEYEDYEVAP